MSPNTTVVLTVTTELAPSLLLSEEIAQQIYEAFRYVLLPCTSVLGIVGNMTSIVILTRRGFSKCSNVLLMTLSISDVLFLTGLNNICMHIYVENVPPGFKSSNTMNYLCYILYITFTCSRNVGLQMAMVIPALITGERLLAVFIPLAFHLILTPQRTLIVVSFLYVLNGMYFLYRYILCVQFKQFIMRDGNILGVIMDTPMYINDVRSGLYVLLDNIVNYTTGIIPISLVTVGCVVIGFQIAVINNKRKKLTSRQATLSSKTLTSKTTKTLLSICVLYVLCSGFAFAIAFITNIQPLDQNTPVKKVLGCVQDLIICVNCVGDCIIYIGGHRGFRKSSKRFLNLAK